MDRSRFHPEQLLGATEDAAHPPLKLTKSQIAQALAQMSEGLLGTPEASGTDASEGQTERARKVTSSRSTGLTIPDSEQSIPGQSSGETP